MDVEPHRLLPLALSLAGSPCLVVGGGAVAARKVSVLAPCGAEVTVVAPVISPALQELAEQAIPAEHMKRMEHAEKLAGPMGSGAGGLEANLHIERRAYREGEAGGYFFVVAATGVEDVDRVVSEDARRAGVLVNVADKAELSSVLLPAVYRSGTVSVAVSTGGASPALAVWLRNRIQGGGSVPPNVDVLAKLLGEARGMIHEREASTEGIDWHRMIDEDLLGDEELLEAAEQGSEAEVRYRLTALVDRITSASG